jgi:hypothetical protein
MTYPLLAIVVALFATIGISHADGVLGGPYRYHGFAPRRLCDDGGAGNGRCLTVIRIGHLVIGDQDWYIRWTSKPTSPLSYRQNSADDPWHTTHVTCARANAGLLCTTVYPQVYYRYGLKVTREFTITPDGDVRLDNVGDGSSSDPGPSYGMIIDDIAAITTQPLPP